VHLNWCYDPGYLSPWILPIDIKKQIVENCSKVMNPWDLHNVEQTLQKASDSTELAKFLDYTKWLDTSRKESFSQVFPELASLLKWN
jgi:hypothetical protein